MLRELILRNRSARKYHQEVAVSRETLAELVDLARLSASGGNRQLLKYYLSCEPDKNAIIYSHIGLGGNPPEGERPSAYILMLGDKEISQSFDFDNGIAAQSILLGAAEKGLGGCMIASIQRTNLRERLNIPERYEIILVIALGRPIETVVLETVKADGDIKYWRDGEGRHYVPKRALADIILP